VIGLLFLLMLVEMPGLLRDKKLYWPLLWGLILMTGELVHLYAVRNQNWGASGPKFSFNYVHNNLLQDGGYFIGGVDMPLGFTLLAILGIFSRSHWKQRLFAFAWFFSFWGLFLFFYAGGYRFNANERFVLLSLAPFAMLAGAGLYRMLILATRWISQKQALTIVGTVFAAMLFFRLPYLRELPLMNWESRDDHVTAEHFATLVPRDGIVMTNDPILFHLVGRDSAQMSIMLEDRNHVVNYLERRYKGKIYLYWDYWCNTVNTVQPINARRILAMYQHTLIEQQVIQGKPYALYLLGDEITPPATPAPFSS
jgi:hypothetical protein